MCRGFCTLVLHLSIKYTKMHKHSSFVLIKLKKYVIYSYSSEAGQNRLHQVKVGALNQFEENSVRYTLLDVSHELDEDSFQRMLGVVATT